MELNTWEENCPDRLSNLCAMVCVKNPHTFCMFDKKKNKVTLLQDLALPKEICEKFIDIYFNSSEKNISVDKFLSIFSDQECTRLQKVNIEDSLITDDDLDIILNHNLYSLNINNCSLLQAKSLNKLNECADNLHSLIIGNSVKIFPESLYSEDFDDELDIKDFGSTYSVHHKRGYLINAPNLRKLVIHGFRVRQEQCFFLLLLKPLVQLTYLDLSDCYNLGNMIYLASLKKLTTLILYDVPKLQESWPVICTLINLRCLDISQSQEIQGNYQNPNKVLDTLVQSLTNLESLDISGTNLAGTGIAETEFLNDYQCDQFSQQTDIPGLKCRICNPLEFLGLYHTAYDACLRHHIPAKKITGDGSELQILNAAEAYLERPQVLQRVLNDLFHIFRYETCCNNKRAMYVVIHSMKRHLHDKDIQIAGSASLFYIVKVEEKRNMNAKLKQLVLCTLLDAMIEHCNDTTMIRNGCLTLCHFSIPQDVLFDYERLVRVLLYIVQEKDQEEFVQRVGIYLLNSLACQVDGDQKQLVGELGAISTMLKLIEDRLEKRLCDEVLEISWSTMWNVTDETPMNCWRFLKGGGMDLFLKCLKIFPDKGDLLRNMMGLMGNVAEVPSLRRFLMTPQFVHVFMDLLESTSDGIEVSYNAAGALSHLMSDGEDQWTISSPSRNKVLAKMIQAINRWDLKKSRNINYRSFEPIFRLVQCTKTPEAQYWATWALANLTTVYPDKYCRLVKEGKGIHLLENILNESNNSHPIYPQIQYLSEIVLQNCQEYSCSES